LIRLSYLVKFLGKKWEGFLKLSEALTEIFGFLLKPFEAGLRSVMANDEPHRGQLPSPQRWRWALGVRSTASWKGRGAKLFARTAASL
jgi:hypothetical protein